MPQPQIRAQIGNQTFSVTEAQTRAFAQAWDTGGIKMILDNTSIQFATAWANIAMKSALENPTVQMAIFQVVYEKLKAAKGKAEAPTTPAPQANPAPEKSLILTDAS